MGDTGLFHVQNTPVQSSREPKLVEDTVNIIQAEERNDVQEEEIVQRPDIEAEILRNIDEEDLRLLDAQPSILNLQTHGLENIQQAGHNRLSQDEEVEVEEEGKTKNYFASLSLSVSTEACFGGAKLQPQQQDGNDGMSAKYLPIILQGKQVTHSIRRCGSHSVQFLFADL